MATITRGTNTTLKSQTLENRLLEAFYLLQSRQTATSTFDVSISVDLDDKIASVTYTLPATHQNLPNGTTAIVGTPSLPGFVFLKGDNGTFVSESLVGQLVEMLMFAQGKEITQYSVAGSLNRITANFDSDRQALTGNYSCSVNTTIVDSNGNLNLSAKEFLT